MKFSLTSLSFSNNIEIIVFHILETALNQLHKLYSDVIYIPFDRPRSSAVMAERFRAFLSYMFISKPSSF